MRGMVRRIPLPKSFMGASRPLRALSVALALLAMSALALLPSVTRLLASQQAPQAWMTLAGDFCTSASTAPSAEGLSAATPSEPADPLGASVHLPHCAGCMLGEQAVVPPALPQRVPAAAADGERPTRVEPHRLPTERPQGTPLPRAPPFYS